MFPNHVIATIALAQTADRLGYNRQGVVHRVAGRIEHDGVDVFAARGNFASKALGRLGVNSAGQRQLLAGAQGDLQRLLQDFGLGGNRGRSARIGSIKRRAE
ncbi:MAG: hypothetical protein MO846_06095 [Candidatus Devosia symbiotica]|nr:hypothetical protein [Candidatus Devosia symbiotica]